MLDEIAARTELFWTGSNVVKATVLHRHHTPEPWLRTTKTARFL